MVGEYRPSWSLDKLSILGALSCKNFFGIMHHRDALTSYANFGLSQFNSKKRYDIENIEKWGYIYLIE